MLTPSITSHDYVRLAAIAVLSPRTVARIYAGLPCEVTSFTRLCAAAIELGLPVPVRARPPVASGPRFMARS